MRRAIQDVGEAYNPYEVIGSGLSQDILMAGRLAMKLVVKEYLELIGSAGKAKPTRREN
jgi:hypothetical protein